MLTGCSIRQESRSGFSWSDPNKTDDPQALLEQEGVPFSDSAADSERRLSTKETRVAPGRE